MRLSPWGRACKCVATGRLVESAGGEAGELTGRSELRCFRDRDCKQASALIERLTGSLKTGAPRLADHSAQFENSKALRPRHYELWLAADAL